MNEKDKQAFTRLIEKRNSEKEAEKVKIRNHIAELNKLKTFENKLKYWTTHLKHKSLLLGIVDASIKTGVRLSTEEEKNDFKEKVIPYKSIFKNANVLKSLRIDLLEDVTNRSERLEVVKAEIERLDATNKDFFSVRFRSTFYDRINGTTDIELTKSKFIEKIKKHIDTKEFTDIYTKYKLEGFEAFDGDSSIDSKVENLQGFTRDLEMRFYFRHIYEGYLLKELVSEINAYPKSIEARPTNDNRITVHITAKKFAALLYVLSTKGVFDLAYFNFNRNDYNGEAAAKLCRKHFQIISQKGKTKGSEVALKYIEQAFKKSEIENVLENGVEPLYQALNNLPNLT